MRRQTRRLIEAQPDDKVAGWFGQSPDMPGHEEVFEDSLQALTLVPEKPKLVLKEHQKSHQLRNQHVEKAEAMGLTVVEATEARTTEDWLAAVDLVVTVFSLWGLNHAFLSEYRPRPLGCGFYLATNELVRRFIAELSGICIPLMRLTITMRNQKGFLP